MVLSGGIGGLVGVGGQVLLKDGFAFVIEHVGDHESKRERGNE